MNYHSVLFIFKEETIMSLNFAVFEGRIVKDIEIKTSKNNIL